MVDEKKIDVKGMSCKSCAEKIEKKVGGLEGVEEVKVDLIKNNALIKFDSGKIGIDKIKKEIIELGYKVDGAGKKKTILQGIAYGLIPHIGCINEREEINKLVI